MSNFSPIDLSKLPAPNVIEEINFENLLSNYINDFKSRNPNYSSLTESDPAIILMQVIAYREMLIRSRINEAAKANMLAFATNNDLDNLSALFGVKRLVDEGDDRLRKRTQLALEGFSTAGPVGSYIFHALSAASEIKSVSVKSPNPGEVLVTILSNIADGSVSNELIDIVNKKLNSNDVRPITDLVSVQGAKILNYEIKAIITVYPGPSSNIVKVEARNALEKFIASNHEIGKIIPISGIYDALHINGVKKVELITPKSNIETNDEAASYCANIELEIASDE